MVDLHKFLATINDPENAVELIFDEIVWQE